MALHKISVRIEIESENKEKALDCLDSILTEYVHGRGGTIQGYKVLTTVPTTSGLDTRGISALLHEWEELLAEQRQLIHGRGKGDYLDGLVGISVAKDEIALGYQKLSGRIWDIKWSLFNDYQTQA